MGMTATWCMGQTMPTTKGTHKPNSQQTWIITAIAEGNNGIRQRWTLRPKQKCTLHDIHDYIMDELAAFERENGGFLKLTWTAISR